MLGGIDVIQILGKLRALAGSAGASIIGFIQTGTGAIAMTLQDLLRGVVWASGYGLSTSATAAANTTALANIAAKLNANGGGVLIIPPGTYQFNGKLDHTAIAQLANLSGVTILALGVTFADQTVYVVADTDYGYLFGFNAVDAPQIFGLRGTSQAITLGSPRGCKWLQFAQGCTGGIVYGCKFDGGEGGIEFYRAYNDPESYRCKNFLVNYECLNMYYPFSAQHSGENVRGVLRATGCGRNMFPYGTRQLDMKVYSKNQKVTSIFTGYNGKGLEDINIGWFDRDSDSCSAAAPPITISFNGTTPIAHRNLNFHVDVKNPAGSPFASTVTFGKYDDAGAADSANRGHSIDGLTFSGVSEQTAGRQHFGTTAGAMHASESLRNVRVKDFRALGASLNDDWSGIIAALQDRMLFENVDYTDSNMVVLNGTAGRVVFLACTAPNFSASTGDTDRQDLISCNIVSGTQQSATNKRFINSPFNRGGGGVNLPANGEMISWTPAVAGTTGAGTATYTTQTAEYTRIGDLGFLFVHLNWSAGTGTGNLKVTGLPSWLTSTGESWGYPASSVVVSGFAAGETTAIQAYLSGNTIFVERYNAGATVAVAYPASGRLDFTIPFRASAL